MKNIITKLLVMVIVAIMVLSLASCATKPEIDFDDACDELEDNGYTVEITKDGLDVNQKKVLYAYDDEDNFLMMIEFKDTKSAKLYYESIKIEYEWRIDKIKAEIDEAELMVETYEYILEEYKNKLDSDEIDEYEEKIDDLRDEIKDLNEELEEAEDEGAFGRSDNVVWIGTTDAIKDSNK